MKETDPLDPRNYIWHIIIAVVCIALTAYICLRYFGNDTSKEQVKADKAKITTNKAQQATNAVKLDSTSTDLKTTAETAVKTKNQLIKRYNDKSKASSPRDTAYDAQWRVVFGTNPPN